MFWILINFTLCLPRHSASHEDGIVTARQAETNINFKAAHLAPINQPRRICFGEGELNVLRCKSGESVGGELNIPDPHNSAPTFQLSVY